MRRLLPWLSLLLLRLVASAQQVPQTGLVAHYALDGTARDSSPGAHHGTVQGGVTATADRNGVAAKAMLFDGTTGRIVVPHAGPLDSLTTQLSLAAWVRIDQYWWAGYNTDTAPILSKTSSVGVTPAQYNLRIVKMNHNISTHQSIQFFPVSGWGSMSVPDIPLRQWAHFAVTYDGNQVSFYRNGQLMSQELVPNPLWAEACPLYLGYDASRFGLPYLNGALDEVCLYNRALTPTEVAGLASRNVTPTQPAQARLALRVYPNPADGGVCYLQPGPAARGAATLSIIDALGRVVRRQAVSVASGAALPFSTAGLFAGLYSVRLQTAAGTGETRLLVQ
jgi:Concanavalin A-like lectin/glucanases superfamily